MATTERRAAAGSGVYRFRVSDAYRIPLRGYMLRLRLLEGEPGIDALKPGRRLTLRAPDGSKRAVRVLGLSTTFGRPTDEALKTKREIDVVISEADAEGDGRVVGIGWEVLGTA